MKTIIKEMIKREGHEAILAVTGIKTMVVIIREMTIITTMAQFVGGIESTITIITITIMEGPAIDDMIITTTTTITITTTEDITITTTTIIETIKTTIITITITLIEDIKINNKEGVNLVIVRDNSRIITIITITIIITR